MSGRNTVKRRIIGSTAIGLCAVLALAAGTAVKVNAQPKSEACPADNGGLTLSPGFCAEVFADNIGHVRHMAQAADGTIYVNTWSGRYFAGYPAPKGPFLVALKDTTGNGKADKITRFGETPEDGSAGGSGIALYKGFVYAEVNDKIVRYAMSAGGGVPTGKPELVLSGMPMGGDHPMHPFVIDPKGQMFIDMGTATNSCQAKNRTAGVPGADPCTELLTRGGTWRYDANKLDQKFSPAERYITGLRNGEGFAFDATGRLFVTQHGRDQLPANWPKLYPDVEHATELPAEEVVELKQGADYGWPFCYYDNFQKKLVLAPEYGGDGGKAVGVCASKTAPVAAFPAHWAPNDMTFYKAKAFPAPYQGGVFIAFHGSWNRAPQPQAGYNVVYQPISNGKASGDYVVFADGFSAGQRDPGKAKFRPTGLLVGSDGALYISDDNTGRIWKVTYHGPAGVTAIAAAPAPKMVAAAAPSPSNDRPPEGANNLPVPPGFTKEQVASGDRLFHAQTCTGCHGADAKGTPVGPNLTSGTWLWGDGSVAALAQTITAGVPQPKQYRSAMPALGGAQLSGSDVQDLAAYLWAVSRPAK